MPLKGVKRRMHFTCLWWYIYDSRVFLFASRRLTFAGHIPSRLPYSIHQSPGNLSPSKIRSANPTTCAPQLSEDSSLSPPWLRLKKPRQPQATSQPPSTQQSSAASHPILDLSSAPSTHTSHPSQQSRHRSWHRWRHRSHQSCSHAASTPKASSGMTTSARRRLTLPRRARASSHAWDTFCVTCRRSLPARRVGVCLRLARLRGRRILVRCPLVR